MSETVQPKGIPKAAIFFMIFSGVLAALLLTSSLKSFRIPTGGMSPTVQPGDYIIATRSFKSEAKFKRGETTIFVPPHDQSAYYIQRIVAIPGDTVDLIDNHLAVNGTLLVSPEGLHSNPANPKIPLLGMTQPNYPLFLKAGEVFVLGDNYLNSLDSRYFGPVEIDSISHTPHFIALPLGRIGSVD